MKRFWALILALALVLQVAVAGVAFSEETETPKVTLTYVDAEGNTKEVVLEGYYYDDENGVYAHNDLPDGGIYATVYEENDTTVSLLVDGDIVLVDKDTYYSAISVSNHVDATVDGDIQTDGTGVVANDDASVFVDGNVEAGGEYENTYNAWNEETQAYDIPVTNTFYHEAVDANDNSIVSIGGMLVSGGTAISATNNYERNEEKSSSVIENGTATVTNVYDLVPNQSTVTVGDDVTSLHGEGVYAYGESTVTLQGDLTADNTAIFTSGKSDVEVAGNVVSENGEGIYSESRASIGGYTDINTYSVDDEGQWDYIGSKGESESKYETTQATVAVGGDLTSYGNAINAGGDSTVDVTGNVNSKNGAGVIANNVTYWNSEDDKNEIEKNQSNITIGGDLTASYTGIQAQGQSTVKVDGDVTSINGNGVNASNSNYWNEKEGKSEVIKNQSSVLIGGDLTSYNSGIQAQGESTVNVGGSVAAGHAMEYLTESGETRKFGSGSGVEASDDATVTIGGGLTSQSTGISARDNAKVSVEGAVTSEFGNGISASGISYNNQDKDAVNETTVTVGGDVNAYSNGIWTNGEAAVHVKGNVTAGHTEKSTDSKGKTYTSPSGSGIIARDESAVFVDGDVTSESTGIYAENTWKSSEPTKIVVNGDGTVTYFYSRKIELNKAHVEVVGDVTSNGSNGIDAQGKATIAVGGSVDAKYDGIDSYGDSGVLVGGNVVSEESTAIYAGTGDVSREYSYTYKCDENGEPLVDKNGHWILVSSDDDWENSKSAGNVEVDGNATAKESTAIYMTGNSNVTVRGDVTGGYVYVPHEDEEVEPYEPTAEDIAYQEAWDKAFKDVEFADEYYNGAIQINLAKEGNEGQLIVGGTVKAYEDNVPVVLNYTVKDQAEMATMPELPKMTIYEVVPEGGEYFNVNVFLEREFEYSYVDEATEEEVTRKAEGSALLGLSDKDHSAIVEAIAKSIQYIINLNAVNGSFTLTGADYDAENGFYTAHEEGDVKVTVTPDEGYGLDGLTATGNYTLTDNGDGTWTLIIHRGGGVTLTATISSRYVEPASASASAAVTEEEAPAPAPVYVTPATKPEKMSDEAITTAVEEALSKNDIPENSKIEVKTDETGVKTVIIAPETIDETSEEETVLKLTVSADMLTELNKSDVQEISMVSKSGKATVSLDVAEVLKAAGGKKDVKLVVSIEENSKKIDTALKALPEKYKSKAGAIAVTARIEDAAGNITLLGTSTNLKIQLQVEFEEGMKILFIDENGNITETEAVWVEATADVPAHWDIPYMGEGTYLPVVEEV